MNRVYSHRCLRVSAFQTEERKRQEWWAERAVREVLRLSDRRLLPSQGGGEHLETAFQYRVFLDTMFHKFLIVFRNATSQPQYHLR